MDITALYKIFLECTSVTTDSRNCPEGSLFIALKGDNSMETLLLLKHWNQEVATP